MKQLFIFLYILCSTSVSAQDVIVKKDGSTILSKVLEVNAENVKYKKHSNLNGPIYTINIQELISINYENGEKDTFTVIQKTRTTSNTQHGLIKKEPAENNKDILGLYNVKYHPTNKLKPKNKRTSSGIAILGVSTNSVMSNDDLEIRFVRHTFCNWNYWKDYQRFYIEITNKSDNTIYIDKGNCFKILEDGNSYCYFDSSEQKTVTEGGGIGGSVGLGSVAGALGVGGVVGQIAGGINVGGNSSRAVSTTYNSQRFIAIPSHGKQNLAEERYVKTKDGSVFGKAEYSYLEQSEDFHISIKLSTPICYGHTIYFKENELPWKRDYLLTYSTDPNFATYSQINIQLYIQEVIGTNYIKKDDYADEVVKLIEGINESTINAFINMDKNYEDPFDGFFK